MRAGVIGLGVGEQHAHAYGDSLAAVCDVDESKLERFPGVLATTDANELIDDPSIDIVSVASFDSDHHAQVMRAIERGKHVFVEKPLCQTEEQAREIARALAEHPDVVLSSNLILRASPRFQTLKGWIDDGRLGRIFHMEGDYDYGRLHKLTNGWRGDLDSYSVTLGGTIHLVDLLLWLSGDRVRTVRAVGNGLATEGSKFRFDDLRVALLELESGAVAKVSANFGCVHPHYHDVKVFGTEATFVNGFDEGTLWTGLGPEAVDAPYPGVRKGALIPSFVEAVAGGPPAAVTADEVFHVMATCFAIDRAAETGETVEVEDLLYSRGR